jgi:hypothetical protein
MLGQLVQVGSKCSDKMARSKRQRQLLALQMNEGHFTFIIAARSDHVTCVSPSYSILELNVIFETNLVQGVAHIVKYS